MLHVVKSGEGKDRERELHTLFKEFDDMKFIKVMIPLQIVN